MCMCMYMYMYMYYVCISLSLSIYLSIYIYIYTHTYIHIHIHVYVGVDSRAGLENRGAGTCCNPVRAHRRRIISITCYNMYNKYNYISYITLYNQCYISHIMPYYTTYSVISCEDAMDECGWSGSLRPIFVLVLAWWISEGLTRA